MAFDVNSLGYQGVATSTSDTNPNSNPGVNNEPEPTSLEDKKPDTEDKSTLNNPPTEEPSKTNTEPPASENEEKPLAAGTKLEVDDKTYTIDDKGNAVDAEGNIFKKAEEVDAWIKSFTVENPAEDNTLANIQKALDVEITDENGNPIKYEDTPEGIQQYVNDVVETARDEIANATMQQFYQQFPFAKDIVDYYIANGNSLDGYGVMPDRSGIEIDDNNIAQQEAIIRTAWKENGQKGDVERYIKYLKDSNTLTETAKAELAGLQEKDENARRKLAAEAAAKHKQDVENEAKYWQSVKDIINSKTIGEYQLADTIVRNVNGQKQSATLNDFYNYISRPDKNGLTDYSKDLLNRKPEIALQNDILQAYLTFTGGDYTSLVKKATNDNEVRTLRLKSAARTKQNTMRVTPPPTSGDHDKESFGY